MTAIAPVYITLTRRFCHGVGPKSHAKLSADTGIPAADLERFGEGADLQPEQVMTIWAKLFGNATFLQASAELDQMGL